MAKSIKEVTVEINNFVNQINQDLQISSSVIFDSIAAQFPEIEYDIERQQLLTEIAVMVNLTTDEVQENIQSFPYSLETIKVAIQAGARLDKENIGQIMDERIVSNFDPMPHWRSLEEIVGKSNSTFVINLSNSDRREVKAAYMSVDGGSLFFEDDNHKTILAFGLGHWVWAERVESNE